MGSLTPVDLKIVEEILEMGSGYVLDFSNPAFRRFVQSTIGVDIYADKFATDGNSKARRLRVLLDNLEARKTAVLLEQLSSYRENMLRLQGKIEDKLFANTEFKKILVRLQKGGPEPKNSKVSPSPSKLDELRQTFQSLVGLQPHPRGLQFEKFLHELFKAYELKTEGAFRLQGEQIDGSVICNGQVYLVEAKWHNRPIGQHELHAFIGILGQRPIWTRGLFISYSSFTEEGLIALGRGKPIVCFDGLDIDELLRRRLDFSSVVEAKILNASKTGSPFARVRDIFPE